MAIMTGLDIRPQTLQRGGTSKVNKSKVSSSCTGVLIIWYVLTITAGQCTHYYGSVHLS